MIDISAGLAYNIIMKKAAPTTHKKSTKKPVVKRTSVKSTKSASTRKSQKVDYYPNRVPFLVAVLAVVTLLVFALLAVYNSR